MKKKLFSLLTLVLAVCSGAWASEVSDLSAITTATTITMDGLNGTSALVDGTLYSSNQLLCLGGCGYSTSKGSTTYNEVSYKNVYQIKSNRQIALKIGFKATITIVGQSNSSRTWRLGTSSAGNEIAESAVNTTTLTANVDGSSTAQLVYINASGDLYLGAIIITANESTEPVISATSPVSIKAVNSGIEVTTDIAVTGEHLTGSTLTATLSPAVTGLSVTLSSSAIAEGTIKTTATLHYSQTENAKGSTTLILSDGTTSENVTVNYTSKVIPTELAAVSSTEITLMDLSKVGTSGMEALTTDDGYVVLTDAGATVSYANQLAVSCISGVGVTWRSDAVQGPLFKFKTTVPGVVMLKFSDVGSSGSRSNRYAAVNEILTDVYSTTSASAGVVTSSPIAVEAGEVVIKGQVQGDGTYTHNQIRVYTITFIPTTTISLNASGYATFSAGYDFEVSGAKAYTATLDFENSKITCAEITSGQVPAGAGVLLYGDPNAEVTLTPITSAAALGSNDLKGTTQANGTLATKGSDNYYVLSGDTFKKFTGDAFGANKAYFEVAAGATPARLAIVFDDETTGIKSVSNGQSTMNNVVYDLQGRRVAQPTKGLYIVNGKKVIK